MASPFPITTGDTSVWFLATFAATEETAIARVQPPDRLR